MGFPVKWEHHGLGGKCLHVELPPRLFLSVSITRERTGAQMKLVGRITHAATVLTTIKGLLTLENKPLNPATIQRQIQD